MKTNIDFRVSHFKTIIGKYYWWVQVAEALNQRTYKAVVEILKQHATETVEAPALYNPQFRHARFSFTSFGHMANAIKELDNINNNA